MLFITTHLPYKYFCRATYKYSHPTNKKTYK